MFERISDLDQRGLTRGNYYSNPIPGIGTSFHNLITDESQFLANKINQTELQTVEERIADFEIRMHSPGVTDLLGTLMYAVIIILLAAAQALAIVVIAFGFIATAVCVLVGPVFVPFFIVPKMEWLFWGWFRCFIQYAFYQVIAAAVVYVIANLILGIMDLQPKGTISTVQLIEANDRRAWLHNRRDDGLSGEPDRWQADHQRRPWVQLGRSRTVSISRSSASADTTSASA